MPLPTNILAEDLSEIIQEAQCAALVLSLQEAPALAGVLGACTSIRNVIVMGRCAARPAGASVTLHAP